jgi:hypothetical protein
VSVNRPHSRYPHVFGVLRIDAFEDDDAPVDEQRLMLPSVFTTEEAAERDAARLNALAEQQGTRARYITLLSRLKE